MMKRDAGIRWTTKKIVSLVLLILSFLMLFLPWMSISINAMGQKFTIPKMLDYLSMYNGYSATEFRAELYDEFVELSEDMAWEGVHMDPKQAMTTFELLSDSKISPLDAARICSFASNLLGETKNYLARNSQDLYGEERILASMITDAAGKVAFAAVLMWVLVIGGIIAFVLSVLFLIKDKKYCVVPYLCISFLLLIFYAVMTSKVNSGVKQLISTFSYGAASFFSEFGINYSSSMDLSVFHLGIAGILSFIFATSALVLTLVREDTISFVKIPTMDSPKKWTCPSCGSNMAATSLFCTSCGTKRPEVMRCTSCGRTLEKDVAFCPHCGASTTGRVTPPPRDDTKKCPSCGHIIPVEATVCSFCSYSFSGSSKLWGTLAKPSDDDLG